MSATSNATRQTLADALDNAQRCPNCSDCGWYAVHNRNTGEPEQEQCEFCYTVEDSLFNVHMKVKAALQSLPSETEGTDKRGDFWKRAWEGRVNDRNEIIEECAKLADAAYYRHEIQGLPDAIRALKTNAATQVGQAGQGEASGPAVAAPSLLSAIAEKCAAMCREHQHESPFAAKLMVQMERYADELRRTPSPQPRISALADLIEELDEKASAAPWFYGHGEGEGGLTRVDDGREADDRLFPFYPEAWDAELLVTLRNNVAEILAALRGTPPTTRGKP